jgi:two-component system, NarL family, sensor kinase
MKQLLFILSCVLIGSFSVNAQSKYVDSLETALKSNQLLPNDRIKLLGKLAYQIAEQKDTVRTLGYANELLNLSQKHNSNDGLLQYYKTLATMKMGRSKFSEALVFFGKQRDLAQRTANEQLETDALNNAGRAYGFLRKYPEALGFYEKALALDQKNKNVRGEATIKSNMSAVFIAMGKTDKALQYAIESIRAAETINDVAILGNSYNNVGRLLNESRRFDESIEYSLKAVDIYEKNKPQRGLAVAYINLGNSYSEKNKLDESHRYYAKGLKVSEDIGLVPGIQICINNMASISYLRGNYQQAITEYERVLSIAQKNKEANSMGIVYQNLGDTYSKLKQYDKALEYFKLAEATPTLTISDKIELYRHRAQFDSTVGDFKSAYVYQLKYRQIQDSLVNEKRNKDLSEIKTKYESDKKEQQIAYLNVQNQLQSSDLEKNKLALRNKELLVKEQDFVLKSQLLKLDNQQLEIQNKDAQVKATSLENERNTQKVQILDIENQLKKADLDKRNTWLAVISGAFLLTCLLGYLFFNRRKLQQEAKLQAEVARQQELATQAVLEAEERERKRIASDLHDGVGQTVMALKMNLAGINDYIEFKNEKAKNIFEKALDLATESAKEVRSISHQMMPNALLKSGLVTALREFISKVEANQLKINLSVNNLNQSIDPNIEKVLYRVIQESVTNVVKHAQASELNIQLSKNQKFIEATIEDNGLGFDSTKKDFEGIGLKNIRDRVAFLKGTVDISSQKGKGTLLAISIPVS